MSSGEQQARLGLRQPGPNVSVGLADLARDVPFGIISYMGYEYTGAYRKNGCLIDTPSASRNGHGVRVLWP